MGGLGNYWIFYSQEFETSLATWLKFVFNKRFLYQGLIFEVWVYRVVLDLGNSLGSVLKVRAHHSANLKSFGLEWGFCDKVFALRGVNCPELLFMPTGSLISSLQLWAEGVGWCQSKFNLPSSLHNLAHICKVGLYCHWAISFRTSLNLGSQVITIALWPSIRQRREH
mgnify:CR=1 FL=1